MDLAAIVGAGILAVAAVYVVLALLPSAAAFKFYTKSKNWKKSFTFAIWYVLTSAGVGIAFAALGVSMGLISAALRMIIPVFLITRVFKKFKVKSEWKLIMWIFIMHIVMAVIILMVLGALILPIIIEVFA